MLPFFHSCEVYTHIFLFPNRRPIERPIFRICEIFQSWGEGGAAPPQYPPPYGPGCFQQMLATTEGRLPQGKGIPDAIALSIWNSINMKTTFKIVDTHMLDTTVNDNHTFTLIKTIFKCYSKMRLYHLSKAIAEMATKNKVRKKFSKLVLFEHQ